MDEEAIRTLKQAHSFDEWRGRNTLPQSLFISGFFLRGDLLQGWRLQRATPVRLSGAPPCVQSIWMPESGAVGAPLRLDVYECDSREAAHELLLRMVGQFQSAGVARRDDLGVGDVNFVPTATGGILFTRGNLLFFLAEAGPVRLPVAEIARQLDQELSAMPEATPRAATARGVVGEPAELAASGRGDRWLLRLESPGAARSAERSYHKVFVAGGDVHAEGGELVVEGAGPDPPRVEVYSVDEQGKSDHRQVRATES